MIKFKINFLILASLLLAPIHLLLAQGETYSEIQIQLSDQLDAHHLQHLELDLDHVHVDEFKRVNLFVTSYELEKLNQAKINYKVLIPDYSIYYDSIQKADRNRMEAVKLSRNPASRFGYGSMGGFYTFSEMVSKLDEMSADFPSITSSKFSIGTSNQGRTIWALKISDNPNVNEDEGAVYYDALHHAREPLSMAVTINFMFYLLENYATDVNVQYIVDNRELYFVPCVNPDGYEYNRQTNPNGGGFWRKNRGNNGTSCVGVDLNRNYGYQFGFPGSCSSGSTCSDTYRGPVAFSEPESSAVRDYMDSIQPSTAFSIHSTAGSYLMPYGYNTSPPAFDIYSEWASDFLSENDHPYGVTAQMLGYTDCGNTRDYMHSEDIYGWTPEIDGSGFWPLQSEIFNLVDENVYPLFYQAWIAGGYTDFQSHTLDGMLVPDSSMYMSIEVKNKGVGDTSSNVLVTLECSDPNISIIGSGTLADLAPRERAMSNSFQIVVDSGFNSASISLDVIISQDGIETDRENILIPAGHKTIFFSDDAESGAGNWTATGNNINWGINGDDSYGGVNSFGDSDNGNAENNTLNYFTLDNVFDLSSSNSPQLEFFSKWSLDAGDFVTVQGSSNGGSSWTTLKTFIEAEAWHQELIDLEDYKTTNFKIRFLMDTDGSIPGDGFYFDNISIIDYDCLDCPICLSSTSTFPIAESFETALENWTQATDDDLNWTRNTGGTPSVDTGPDSAYDGTYYMYIEATNPNFPNKTASLESPCINFSTIGQARLCFQYHMYGTAANMNLVIQASVDAGENWSLPLWTQTGNQGDQWIKDTVNLDTFSSEFLTLRFFGTTGETWQGDIAIDDINIQTCPTTLIVSYAPIPDGIYQASDFVKSSTYIPVNGNVIFQSGAEIDLFPDFEAQLGGQFEAIISDCFD